MLKGFIFTIFEFLFLFASPVCSLKVYRREIEMLNCWYFPENFIFEKFLIFSLAYLPQKPLKIYEKIVPDKKEKILLFFLYYKPLVGIM